MKPLRFALFLAGCAGAQSRPVVAVDPWEGWRDHFRAAVMATRVDRCDGDACVCRAVCKLRLPALPDRSADVTLSIPTLGTDWRVDVLSSGVIEECRHLTGAARICDDGLADARPQRF